MLEAIHPLSIVILSIWPSIAADAIGFSILILTFIEALVWEFLRSVAFLLIICPLSFVNPLVFIEHDTQALLLTVEKIAVIRGFFVLLAFKIGGFL
jgi:hypothetical protein